MFDTHCHLSEIDAPETVLSEAVAHGLEGLVACSYSIETTAALSALGAKFPGLPVAFGLHPRWVSEPWLPIEDALRRNRPIAVGECGLEKSKHRLFPSFTLQRRVLAQHFEVAVELGLPVSVHSTHAVADCWELVRSFPLLRGVMHAFSGSYEQAKAFIDRGWLLGVGPAMTQRISTRLRSMLARLPLAAMVLETDAPSMPLGELAAREVRPWHVATVAASLAQLHDTDAVTVLEVTRANALGLFGARALWHFPCFPGVGRNHVCE